MMEAAIRTLLLADATVAGLVADRIYPLVLPQKPTLPAVTYQRISTPIQYAQGGPSLATPRLQIDCWAGDYDSAKALAAAVAAVLSGYKGTTGGLKVLGVFSGGRDSESFEADARPTSLYRNSSDYMVWIAAVAA